jgi:4-aminobutyrate aminotransferase/(S)-3-amino-2-methylpropionate transaminase
MSMPALDWLSRFRQVHPAAACRDHDPKFGPVFVRGAGSRLWDSNGDDFIDLTCGYSAANFGQAFPPLVAAATRQLHTLSHVTGDPHVGRIELAEKLLSAFQLPTGNSRAMFNVTGARAVETAWKAAVAYRPGKLLTIGPCYHGRSLATLTLSPMPPASPRDASCGQFNSDEPQKVLAEDASPGCSPWSAEVIHAPATAYPYCSVCPVHLTFPNCELSCVRSVLQIIGERAQELSAVLVEPAIGARGTIAPPGEFLLKLRRLTQQHGILLIADEVQTGLGRYGSLSLSQAQGWRPDLLVIGKSLGGGLVPISAVLGRADVLDQLPIGSESETYAGSPLATAVAIEVLSQLCSGNWIAEGARLGAQLRALAGDSLRRQGHRVDFFDFSPTSVQHNPCIHSTEEIVSEKTTDKAVQVAEPIDGGNREHVVIEGLGACCVIEFAHATSKGQAAARARRLAESCLRNRLLTQLTGTHLTRLALFPAFTMNETEYACAAERLQQAIHESQ